VLLRDLAECGQKIVELGILAGPERILKSRIRFLIKVLVEFRDLPRVVERTRGCRKNMSIFDSAVVAKRMNTACNA
jgi:hypothetical protein